MKYHALAATGVMVLIMIMAGPIYQVGYKAGKTSGYREGTLSAQVLDEAGGADKAERSITSASKWRYGQRVKITVGFYGGMEGKLRDIFSMSWGPRYTVVVGDGLDRD